MSLSKEIQDLRNSICLLQELKVRLPIVSSNRVEHLVKYVSIRFSEISAVKWYQPGEEFSPANRLPQDHCKYSFLLHPQSAQTIEYLEGNAMAGYPLVDNSFIFLGRIRSDLPKFKVCGSLNCDVKKLFSLPSENDMKILTNYEKDLKVLLHNYTGYQK